MVGILKVEPRKGLRVTLARISAEGLPLLCATVPGLPARALERRVARAAELLARAGCRRVLTGAASPHRPILEARGLRPVDPAPLCQTLAVPLALAALERRGLCPARAAIALRGSRVGRPMFQAAEKLCPQVRRLLIAAPSGGEELARYLREEYGVPVLEDGAERADLSLCFSPGEAGDLRLSAPELYLDGFRLCADGRIPPDEADELAFLALLWEEGRISADSIQIISTSPPGNGLDR